jgi:hypothetical protein
MMRRSPKNILLESSSSREVFLRWLVFVMLMALFFSTASFNDDSTFTNHNGWNAGIPTIAIVVTAFQPPTVVARRSYHSQQQQAHWYKREEQMQALFSTTRLSSDKISAGDDSYNDEPARTAIVDTNTNANTNINADLGEFDPSTKIEVKNPDKLNVGNPQQKVLEKEFSVNAILKELAAIQQQGPQKYCILGTRHCSYLHQQIIELLYVYWFY